MSESQSVALPLPSQEVKYSVARLVMSFGVENLDQGINQCPFLFHSAWKH
jgi:hypothetical protein